MAESAVVAVRAVEDAVVVHAVFGFVAREGHVAVLAAFCVLAKGTICVIYALETDAWGFEFELFELLEEGHVIVLNLPFSISLYTSSGLKISPFIAT